VSGRGLGRTVWVVPGGFIPERGTGPEPEMTSHDLLCVLNTGDDAVELEVTIYRDDREPVGPYPLTVAARRVRHVRVNDLIDPAAPALGCPYGVVVRATAPAVVQFVRQDTRQAANALMSVVAFDGDG
jgi:hypothetical protein